MTLLLSGTQINYMLLFHNHFAQHIGDSESGPLHNTWVIQESGPAKHSPKGTIFQVPTSVEVISQLSLMNALGSILKVES